eukprot:c15237_g2_i1 orf=1-369(-)
MAPSLLSASSSCTLSSSQFKGFDGLRASAFPATECSFFLPRYGSLETSQKHKPLVVHAALNSPKLQGRNLRVAVIGGGPAGGCAAETLAKGGVETFLIERKLDNAKPCGGAIPICMVGEFDLP